MLLAMKYKNLFTKEFQTKVNDIVFSFQTSASGPFLILFASVHVIALRGMHGSTLNVELAIAPHRMRLI
jgi:hypothetical protein